MVLSLQYCFEARSKTASDRNACSGDRAVRHVLHQWLSMNLNMDARLDVCQDNRFIHLFARKDGALQCSLMSSISKDHAVRKHGHHK